MITRVDRKQIHKLPQAVEIDGLLFCPLCWRPVAEPVEGKATAAVWCRACKKHVIIHIDKT